MAVDDFLEPEVGVAVALTAALASPKVRGFLRSGAVYGLAGVLMAGDAVSSLVNGLKRGVAPAAAVEGVGDGTFALSAPENGAPLAEDEVKTPPRSRAAKGAAAKGPGHSDDVNE